VKTSGEFKQDFGVKLTESRKGPEVCGNDGKVCWRSIFRSGNSVRKEEHEKKRCMN
jgi:hypothetical protein